MTTATPNNPGGPDVVVVGGGIGGLATAAFLQRAGVPLRLFERAPHFGEVGAGILVAPNAGKLLRRLGLGERLREVGTALQVGWEFRRWEDGTVLSQQPLGDRCVERYGEHMWTLHRADLVDIVAGAVPPDVVTLGAHATGVRTSTDGVRVDFADGRVANADIVIAADGINSTLRAHVAGSTTPPRFSGLCAWRCLVPAEAAPAFARRPAQTLWLGPRKHVVHYPVSSGKLINVGAITRSAEAGLESWEAEGDPAELLVEFAGWDRRLLDLLSAAERVGRYPLLDRDPLPSWVRGRVGLLGDAAHPMFPLFAQGAAQAIEDAAALAVSLAHRDATSSTVGLQHYDDVRRPRASRLQQVSHDRRHHHHLDDGAEQRKRDAQFAAEDPLAASEWIYGHDAERAVSAATP